MHYRVKTPLDHNKHLYAPGTVVELSEKQAAPLLPDVVEQLGAEEAAGAPDEDLSYNELREKAKALGLKASGSKEELIERIAEAEAKAAESATLPEDAPVGVLPEDENPGGDL
jgi:hypothetical protein